jgi:hypothetical protein
MNAYYVVATWAGMALLASLVSIRLAFVPTLIAQQLFRLVIVDAEKEEALGAEDLSGLTPR